MRISKTTFIVGAMALGSTTVSASKSTEGLAQISQGIQQIGQGALGAVEAKKNAVQEVRRLVMGGQACLPGKQQPPLVASELAPVSPPCIARQSFARSFK